MSTKSQLISAIESNNNEEVSKLLEQMDVGEVNEQENGQTALGMACRRFNNEALHLLLSKPGIDVNFRGFGEQTPLHRACQYNNAYAASKILVNPQIDVNVQNDGGWTPLHYACKHNHHKIVAALLTSPGIQVNIKIRLGYTPVMYAAGYCHEESLGIMLEDSRVDVDCKDYNGGGLDVLIQLSTASIEEKRKCLEMIYKERMKREKRQMEREQLGQEGNIGISNEGQEGIVGICIQEIEKLNKEIEDEDKRLDESLGIKKQKKRDLDEKHALDMQTVAKKYKEEEAVLDKKHKEDETMLEATFAKQEQVERRHIAELKERRDELAKNLQKITNEPDKDTSDDHDKIEAAKKSLECPICMELMKPPTRIWMCHFTHIICELCKDRLNGRKCPTCTTEPVTLRAFLAENLARTIFNN